VYERICIRPENLGEKNLGIYGSKLGWYAVVVVVVVVVVVGGGGRGGALVVTTAAA